MTDDEARRLATRIIDTWPNGPRAYIWRDTLIDLDYELAVHAYRTLEREVVRGAPTPGQFHAAYNAHTRALNPPTTEPAADTEPFVSLGAHLDDLRDRARRGDTEAVAELHSWQRARRQTR